MIYTKDTVIHQIDKKPVERVQSSENDEVVDDRIVSLQTIKKILLVNFFFIHEVENYK